MSAVLLILLVDFLLIAAASVGFMLYRRMIKKKHVAYDTRIKSLQDELATEKVRLGTELTRFKTIQENNEFEKYAGVAVSAIDSGVIAFDTGGVVKLINEYARRYLDLAAEVGMSYKEVIHGDLRPFEAALRGEKQKLPDSYQLSSTHGTFPISGMVYPMTNGVVFMFNDITKEVARVKEEQAFFSAAAHELRTPLTIIRMTVSLLKDRFDTLPREKIIEHLRRTDETTERLVRLVNEFLNISRIDQGRLEMLTEKVDIVTLTDEVIRDLGLLAKERSLYVHHDVTGNERMVVADRAKTTEVLANLIGNALKYTIQGGVTVSHTVSETSLTTLVSDTGPGIPKEMQTMLFKRFVEVGETHKGSGLGLYISKKFAQLMRGDVALVKSEPGAGSVFAFTLPLR